LRSKSEAADALIELLKQWETQTGRKLKAMRTDQGTEFLGSLERFCRERGVKRELSAAYTPQQNARAERLNRTLLERCRAMMLDGKIPKRTWPLVMDAAAHVKNLVKSGGMRETPFERFFGKKPDL
jgi:transposase InsO family protein